MGADDVAATYERARAGFAAWRRANPLDRAAVLSAAADLIRSKAEDGAVTLVRENGKTPALMAGNAVVLKPARQTPLIARWLADQLASAGLPGEVLGLVTGRDQDISQALLGHSDLDALTFTGSTATGAYLRKALSGRNVRLQTETGGKNASVVLGPLATPEHRDGVLAHVGRATADGADMIIGGARPADGALQHGCYVEPTIISVSPRHALWRDEVFGPVVAVCQASGFDEAAGLANDSRYGLSAAVFTTSLRLANEFIDRAEAGQVAVNLPTSGWDVHHPFGGFRDSGSAFKEQGAPGLRFYTRLKTAAVRFAW